ncbi:hypothetical protein SynROS8604_01908 [Synechococcus sp. ROS8604]|nr:hypothetical protein SynROS8604_01908 [Synechococcus sp. ROS8604]
MPLPWANAGLMPHQTVISARKIVFNVLIASIDFRGLRSVRRL